MNVPVPSLRQKMPTLPPVVEQVILTALAKDPHQRYTSVQEFANALEVASQPPPPPPMHSTPPAPIVQHVSPVPKNAPAQATRMVRCPRCGGSISANSIFCNICGSQLAASTPETVRVPPTPTPFSAPSPGTTLLTYGGHSDGVRAVAWSPDGHLLASTSSDGTVQVWEASTGKTRLTYRGHSFYMYAVAWSPDGRLLASASGDKTVQVWQAV